MRKPGQDAGEDRLKIYLRVEQAGLPAIGEWDDCRAWVLTVRASMTREGG